MANKNSAVSPKKKHCPHPQEHPSAARVLSISSFHFGPALISSLSSIFLAMPSFMKQCTSGSDHVWQNVAYLGLVANICRIIRKDIDLGLLVIAVHIAATAFS